MSHSTNELKQDLLPAQHLLRLSANASARASTEGAFSAANCPSIGTSRQIPVPPQSIGSTHDCTVPTEDTRSRIPTVLLLIITLALIDCQQLRLGTMTKGGLRTRW